MNNEHKQTPIVTVPCVTFQFNANLDRTRENFNNVTAQFNIPLDWELEKMHECTDKVMEVISRQADFHKLNTMYDQLHSSRVFLTNAEQDIQRLDAQHQASAQLHVVKGKRTPYELSTQEKQQKVQARNNLDNMSVQIQRLEAEITAMEEKLGVNIGTDS